MHATIIAWLLPFLLAILPTTFAAPSDALIGGYDGGSSHDSCSANQGGSIPDWAANPAWVANMTSCMQVMNRPEYDGIECKPALANGTTLGPSFKFWKGEKNYHGGSGSFCYSACTDCLSKGIGWNQAQTTYCENTNRENWHSKKKTCTMGFDYGVWAQTGTSTPP